MKSRFPTLLASTVLSLIGAIMAAADASAQNAQQESPAAPPDDVMEAIERFADTRRGPNLKELGGGLVSVNAPGACHPTVFTVEDDKINGEPHLDGGDAFLLLGPLNDGRYMLIPDPSNSSDWGIGPYTMHPTLFPNFFDVSPNVEINPHSHEPDQTHRMKIHIEKFENPPENCPSYLWIWNFGAPGTPIPDDPGHGGARGY